MNILITGGSGYIGSHICVSLLNKGHKVIILDNYKNSYPMVVHKIKEITGCYPIHVFGDIRDINFTESLLKNYECQSVIHLAGLKSVNESQKYPLDYYNYNVLGTIQLLKAMKKCAVKKIIFSSSSTVYGIPKYLPYDENHSLNPENVYGRTKLIIENILEDCYKTNNDWSIIILRYFNPSGSHKSGLIGEHPKGIPNNLIPIISKILLGKHDKLTILGNDHNTKDGTGVRDYVHVLDVVSANIKSLNLLEESGYHIFNLGSGKGYSVFDVVNMFENITNTSIPYTFGKRRPGDIPQSFSNNSKAYKELSWSIKYNLFDICKDAWNFCLKNPNGYK